MWIQEKNVDFPISNKCIKNKIIIIIYMVKKTFMVGVLKIWEWRLPSKLLVFAKHEGV